MAQRATWTALPSLAQPPSTRRIPHYLISRRLLQQCLGALWLLDGLLQLQPWMWTMNFVTGIMQPTLQGQPGPIAAALKTIITLTTPHHIAANAVIALVQVALGVCLLSGSCVRPALLGSVVWSLMVWVGGEGLGMLLTGQASVLTGAPGAVLLYGLLALAAYPAQTTGEAGLLGRRQLRWLLAGCWTLAAVLQLQPFWWQSQQIAQTISGLESPSTLNGAIQDSSLRWLAHLTSTVELPLNSAIILLALGLAFGLAVVRATHVRPLLVASIVLSLLLWWATEACGQLLTGTATDVNSGPLLVLLALACWPRHAGAIQEEASLARTRSTTTGKTM